MRLEVRVRDARRARPAGGGARRRPGLQVRAARRPAAKAEEAAKQDRIAWELSTPCRADLKGKKIMLIIGEVQSNGYIAAQQQNYGPHFQAINARLRASGS